MNTHSANQKGAQPTIEQRILTMRILWIGMFLSIGGYYVLTFIAERSEDLVPNDVLSLVLVGFAGLSTAVSFLIKNKLLKRAVDQQQVALVQQGYIVAWAITEVAALLGLLDFFATAHPHYYIPFLIAAGGMLLHFPRREHLLNASFKSSAGLT